VTLAVQQGGSVILSPATATLAANHRVTLTAQVVGVTNAGMAWSVNGIAGGNATIGEICTVSVNPCQPVTNGTAAQVDYLAPGSGGSACPVRAHQLSSAGSVAVQWSTALGTSPVTILTQNQTANGQLNEIEQVITQSIGAWMAVEGTTLTPVTLAPLSRVATTNACGSDGVNSICFDQADSAFAPGVLAFTRVITADAIGAQVGSGAPATQIGQILDADIYFDPSDSSITFATPAALPSNPQAYDLESLLTHKFGHFLGFSHSAVWSAIMYPYAPHPAHSTAPGQRHSSRMRCWTTTTAPVFAPYTHRPRITLTWVQSAGKSSRPIRSRCRLRRWELLASLGRTLLPSIAEAARSSPEPSAAGAVPLQVRRNSTGVTPSSGSRWATPTPCMPNRWMASWRQLKSARQSRRSVAMLRPMRVGRRFKGVLCPQWTPALRRERVPDCEEAIGTLARAVRRVQYVPESSPSYVHPTSAPYTLNLQSAPGLSSF
jgi:hypothetical protein